MAAMNSRKRFLGVPCSRCGGAERFRSDHSCVRCKLEQSTARRVAAAKARKSAGASKTFRGKPCQACGLWLRFRATGKCVACDRAGYYARNGHRQRRTYPRRDALARGEHTYVGKPARTGTTAPATRSPGAASSASGRCRSGG